MKNRHLLLAVAVSSLVATVLSLALLLRQGAHAREVAALKERLERLEERPRPARTVKEAWERLEKFFSGP